MAREKKEGAAPKEKKEKGAAKQGKSSVDAGEAEAMQTILDYINAQNRPFNHLLIFNNLHQKVGKTLTQKVLDNLSASGKITAKPNGKMTIYYARQDQFPIPDKEELTKMDEETKKLVAVLQEHALENKQLSTNLSQLESALTDEEIELRIQALKDENERIQARLERLGDGSNLISPEQKARVEKTQNQAFGEWKKRKNMCMGVVRALSDQADQKPAQMMETLGVESDESVGVDMAALLQSLDTQEQRMNWDPKHTKSDQVKLESIWREHLHKETIHHAANFQGAQFQCHPKTVQAIPEKPNHTTPSRELDVTRASSSSNDPYLGTLHDSYKTPKEKYTGPQTSSQEVGWFHERLTKPNENFHRPAHYCEETKIVEDIRRFGNKPY